MSEEIHLTPEELERISKALENFGSKMQALVNIAKIPEGIIAFFESPAWGNVQKIIADAYNVNEKLLNSYHNSVLQAYLENFGQSLVSLPDSRLMTQIDKLLIPDYTNVVKNLGSTLGKMSSIISEAYEMAQNYAFDEEESDLETEFISQQEFEQAVNVPYLLLFITSGFLQLGHVSPVSSAGFFFILLNASFTFGSNSL